MPDFLFPCAQIKPFLRCFLCFAYILLSRCSAVHPAPCCLGCPFFNLFTVSIIAHNKVKHNVFSGKFQPILTNSEKNFSLWYMVKNPPYYTKIFQLIFCIIRLPFYTKNFCLLSRRHAAFIRYHYIDMGIPIRALFSTLVW